MDNSQRLQQAHQLAREGHRPEAQRIVREILTAEPDNADAWYMAGFLADTDENRIKAIERALAINPAHEQARQVLAKLRPQDSLPGQVLEVQLRRPNGCVLTCGTLLSFGLLLIVLRMVENQVPARMTDQEMILRSGKRFSWDKFKRLKAFKVVNSYGGYIGTRIELAHELGNITFGTDKIKNEHDAMQFMMSHLPSNVVEISR